MISKKGIEDRTTLDIFGLKSESTERIYDNENSLKQVASFYQYLFRPFENNKVEKQREEKKVWVGVFSLLHKLNCFAVLFLIFLSTRKNEVKAYHFLSISVQIHVIL